MSDQLALNAAVDPPQVAEHDESAPLRPRPSPQRERHSPPAAANASASATASKTTTRMQVKRHTKQWHRLKRYLWQQRALKVTTACTMFSSLLWIVCVATDNWLVYHFNEPHTDSQQNKILYYKSGLWRSCVITGNFFFFFFFSLLFHAFLLAFYFPPTHSCQPRIWLLHSTRKKRLDTTF